MHVSSEILLVYLAALVLEAHQVLLCGYNSTHTISRYKQAWEHYSKLFLRHHKHAKIMSSDNSVISISGYPLDSQESRGGTPEPFSIHRFSWPISLHQTANTTKWPSQSGIIWMIFSSCFWYLPWFDSLQLWSIWQETFKTYLPGQEILGLLLFIFHMSYWSCLKFFLCPCGWPFCHSHQAFPSHYYFVIQQQNL